MGLFDFFTNRQKNKTCPRCGIDLSLLRKGETANIDGVMYCDACAVSIKNDKKSSQLDAKAKMIQEKIQNSEEQKDNLTAEKPVSANVPDIAVAEDYLKALKSEAISYLPLKSTAQHLESIFCMLDDLLHLEMVRVMLEDSLWKRAQQEEQDGASDAEETVFLAFAETGFRINMLLDVFNAAYIEEKLASADKEMLLKAFIAADFYAFHLNEQSNTNLIQLQRRIARELLRRGYTTQVSRTLTEFEQLKARCNAAVKENPDAEVTKALITELGKMVQTLDQIYVICDEDFNNRFPFVGTDGRAELCSNRTIADNLAAYYHAQHMGHISVRGYGKEQVVAVLHSLQEMGLAVFRLDNGVKPVDIWLKDIIEPLPANLLERANNGIKGILLRELQYGYRIKKLDSTEKGGKYEHDLTEMMLTMRYNAYRDLGNGLCYVLSNVPAGTGTTYFTKSALSKAKEMLTKENFDESALIAPGDSAFAVYEGEINLQVAKRPGQTWEESLVCAFTGHNEAEAARHYFAQYGTNDGVLVVTFDELYTHAMQCAGILVDMTTYGMEIRKEEFPDVLKWRAVDGMILIGLKNDN